MATFAALLYVTPAFASQDVITTGYSGDLQSVLPNWNPATNPDAILDVSTNADYGNQVIPFGSSLYVGGYGYSSVYPWGLIIKFDTPSGRKQWLVNNNIFREFRAMAVDLSGDIYTGFTSSAYSRKFAKYSGSDGSTMSGWPRQERTKCGYANAEASLVVENGMLYAGGGNYGPFSGSPIICNYWNWELFATTTGTPTAKSTSDYWTYEYQSGYMSMFTTQGNGSLALGSYQGNRYLYAFGQAWSNSFSQAYNTIRYKINAGVIDTTPDPVWGKKIESATYPMQIAVDDNPSNSTYGNVYITGYVSGPYAMWIYYTVAYDAAGNRKWIASERYADGRSYVNPPQHNQATAIAISPDGGSVYVTGKSFGDWTNHFYTIRYNTANGAVLNRSVSNFGLKEQPLGIAATPSGVYITGYVPLDTATNNKTNLNAFAVTTNPTLLQQGGDITISGQVKNTGLFTARPFAVQFCVDSAQMSDCTTTAAPNIKYSTTTRALPVGTLNIKPATISTQGLSGANHTLTMCVDPYNVVTETTPPGKTDNCKQTNFTLLVPPDVTLRVNDKLEETINPKESATLSWNATNAISCKNAVDGGMPAISGTNSSASTGSLTDPRYDYQISCTGAGGTGLSNIVTVYVLNPQASITATPDRVPKWGSSDIRWSATDVTDCSITQNGEAWKSLTADENKVIAGEETATNISVKTEYVMSCNNGLATATASVTVNIPPTYQDF
ncbi:hypothetical protein A3G63_00325 [Candidatus Kaiserbacteria bacterium RIFCSPLOWO2_12_FULL_52_8]|uniref:CARDB domain-containing protein n=1 Tax=Candidatus Kaiserbacteria bacterium RIFCSPHIGHO2_01_FULL_53_31 TaxID=1798481 RepID=A0A1F6CHJ1_9BACT|nr:MAG: hypothetical protein A2678_02215 [Candidatus Kaiserbacteria bacterium RIFCSPHIGHO2_01_FULL_53_31]OGG92606.1 MAG: hypothetical protein A3G63_00325 [Candidatus Kaiserbacteria bacterium RIFCSPLOWO2_12_FULL_52_8]